MIAINARGSIYLNLVYELSDFFLYESGFEMREFSQ